MKKDALIYMQHIRDAIFRIKEYTLNITHEEFMNNHLIQDAVIRQIEIIGEATKKLSRKVRDIYPDIPWKDMAGMRDKLIHDYFGVDIDAVWMTVEQDIPAIEKEIMDIIEKLEK